MCRWDENCLLRIGSALIKQQYLVEVVFIKDILLFAFLLQRFVMRAARGMYVALKSRCDLRSIQNKKNNLSVRNRA